ncbi:ABC transporter ATP-binding protein [Paenibacillus terrigena]|uniref:ABC transporter ATP-binding protein n=1 Tax=Paenibacillus terrigena TaxID=369333 RepID=UPI0028D26538|nr:ABC transporter ATP-binding protein [Paenibacillus terrigena]
MEHIVRTNRLTKIFQEHEVVSSVSMNIKKGEIYGFLGPNGAGKTTVMKMMTNLVKPTSGEIEIFGEKLTPESYHLLGRIGTIIEYPVFYDKLTARENLELHCEYMGFYNKKAIDEALELVNLIDTGKKKVKTFSLGMKQRLGIARAITTKPELLIFDEPINGLDPLGIKEIRDVFRMLCKEYGTTLLISSHILGEIEQVADTIGVIQGGRLLREITMAEIHEETTNYIEIMTNDCSRAAFVLSDKLQLNNIRVIDNQFIRIYDQHIAQSEITKVLILNDVVIDSIHKRSSSLEEYFLQVLNGGEVRA